MILRRLAQNLKAQNWTAIWIEFVLLVLGVFLGIQVSNWNSARTDQRLATRYLTDIASDIRSDLAEIARVQDSAMARVSAAAYVLGKANVPLSPSVKISDLAADDIFAGATDFAMPAPAPPPPAERDQLWALAFRTYGFDMNRGAYDALIGSGKLDLVADPKIMASLRQYYYLVNVLDKTQTRTTFPIRNAAVETAIQHGLSPATPIAEADLIARIEQTPPLAASLATLREYSGLILLLCQVQQQKGEELLRMLEPEHAP